ncbi:MAG: hypothetical protein O8C67_14475 [Candidatus Methanoperedens sp.]|nr:hypothetical protein [Candidatus Methanoperedens sp.]
MVVWKKGYFLPTVRIYANIIFKGYARNYFRANKNAREELFVFSGFDYYFLFPDSQLYVRALF